MRLAILDSGHGVGTKAQFALIRRIIRDGAAEERGGRRYDLFQRNADRRREGGMAHMKGVEPAEAGWFTRLVYWFVRRKFGKLTGKNRLIRARNKNVLLFFRRRHQLAAGLSATALAALSRV